jgi:hypothetical protein
MNVPASLRSDQVAVMPWIGWPLCSGLDGRNGVDQVAAITGMRIYLPLAALVRNTPLLSNQRV